MQVLELRPLTDSDWDTAVILRRVDDDVEPIYAYLDPRRKIDSPRGRSLLRLIDEHVIESFTSRASELYMRAEHVPAGVAKQLAEAEARCAVVEARLQRLLASRSYRLAAGISSVWRAPTRVLGRGR
jgi:hypothetical protein